MKTIALTSSLSLSPTLTPPPDNRVHLREEIMSKHLLSPRARASIEWLWYRTIPSNYFLRPLFFLSFCLFLLFLLFFSIKKKKQYFSYFLFFYSAGSFALFEPAWTWPRTEPLIAFSIGCTNIDRGCSKNKVRVRLINDLFDRRGEAWPTMPLPPSRTCSPLSLSLTLTLAVTYSLNFFPLL